MAFCTNCGSPLPDGTRFCTKCGARVEAPSQPQAPGNYGDGGQSFQQNVPPAPSFEYQGGFPDAGYPQPPKSKLPVILGIIAAVICAAGIGLGASTLILGHAPWSSGDKSAKEEVEDDEDEKTAKKEDKKKDSGEDEDEDAESEAAAAGAGSSGESPEVAEAKEKLDAVTGKAQSYLNNPEFAVLSRFQEEAQQYLDSGDAVQAENTIRKMENLTGAASGQSPIEIEVEQADASIYPTVKLYARVYQAADGSSVDDLRGDGFFVTEKVGSGTYTEIPVKRAMQLNQAERLNICMTADLSGSMMGTPLAEAKSVMSQFLSNVQQQAGDEVSLISFNDEVSVHTTFSNDIASVANAVNALNIPQDKSTALYDALYVSLQQTAQQSGAKCIIAFTDGEDNASQVTPEAVAAYSRDLNIPIYIIGVGSLGNTAKLQEIADAAGGFYNSVSQISSMGDIYNEAFRKQKEMYLIEYETQNSQNQTDVRDIELNYADDTRAAITSFSYVPEDLIRPTVADSRIMTGDYVIPFSDREYVTAMDLNGLTAEQLRLARNEIYARKGRLFKDQSLQSYFNSKSWYHGTIAPDSFRESMLSDVEKANAYFILNYERLKGFVK